MSIYAINASLVQELRHRRLSLVAGVFGLTVSVFVAGCSHPSEQPVKQVQLQSGIQATIDVEAVSPDGVATGPPHSGDNTVYLDLVDSATGRTLSDATVTGTADMLAPKIAGQQVSGRDKGNGRYEIPVRLGIAAKYDLHVEVTKPGQQPVDFLFPIEAWQ